MPLLNIIAALAIIISAVTGLVAIWQMVRRRARVRHSLSVSMLQVTLPKDLQDNEREEGVGDPIKERIAVAEQWLSTLVTMKSTSLRKVIYGAPTLVLELVAREDGVIVFYAGTQRPYLDHLEKQIYAFYPEAAVEVAAEHTIFELGDAFRGGYALMKRQQFLPLATYQDLEVDPMQALTGALAKLQKGDGAIIQYVCQAASSRAQRKGRQAAKRTILGKQSDVGEKNLLRGATTVMQDQATREKAEADAARLTPRAQQRVELVEEKVSQPQFLSTIRVGVSTRDPEESERVFNAISGAFSQYDMPDLNGLTLRSNSSKSFMQDLIFREFNPRRRVTLSTTELTSLFHYPLATTPTPNILWRGAKTAPAPPDIPTTGIKLGTNEYRGVATPIYFSRDDRRRHLYLIGQTGTGKTTLFLNMITQDIAAGEGLAVIDPHGDLIEDILLRIPPERAQDVILFDPRDTERPLGFNILQAKDPAQKDLIVNEVVQILQKLAARLNPESIGPMFEHYLRNALLALVEDPNATLIDVPRMFVDETFRAKVLQHNIDPTVRQFWEQEFAQSQRGQMSADMLSYVISKLGRFIGNATIRNIIGQPDSSFDVRQIMDEKKILLCNLSKGLLGDINADLLGFVLVSKIQIAALGRANVAAQERPDFYLYLDEFQNFTTDSIATILSEARKYRLNLNLTHQFIEQLDEPIKEAVFGNVGTIVSYRIGVEDAEVMAQQFQPVFSDYDLINLERFTAYVRLLANSNPTRPFSLRISPPANPQDSASRDQIRDYSRHTYGRNRANVQQSILERFSLSPRGQSSNNDADDYLSESLFDIS